MAGIEGRAEEAKRALFWQWQGLRPNSNSLWHDFYLDFETARLALEFGLAKEIDLTRLTNKFIKFENNWPDLIRILEFWSKLSVKHPEFDGGFVRKIWSYCWKRIPDPFERAYEAAIYAETTADSQSLGAVVEEMTERLPSYEKLERLYSRGEGAELIFYVANTALKLAKIGRSSALIDNYLLGCFSELDLSVCYGTLTYYLLNFISGSTYLDSESKKNVFAVTFRQQQRMAASMTAHDMVLVGLVEGYLSLDQYERAEKLWAMIKDSDETDAGLYELLCSGLPQGRAAEIRKLRPQYLVLGGRRKDLWEWSFSWYRAAAELGRNETGFYLDEPEIAGEIGKGSLDFELAEIYRICNLPKYQRRAFQTLVKVNDRIDLLTKEYKAGKLRPTESRKLLEAKLISEGV